MRDTNCTNTIKCPCCGWEYAPGEIYLPKHFLGQPTLVERDTETGKLRYCSDEMNLDEHYICDNCKTPFAVKAKVVFSTSEDKNFNFNSEYVTSLKKQSLFLDEE